MSSGQSMKPPVISVCILAGHGPATLDACLASLHNQLSPPAFELLVGGVVTPALTGAVHRYFPTARVCRTSGRLPGAARNSLIELATGELLLFLDDDVTAPGDLLSSLAEAALRHPEASVFGGPNETPPRSSRFQVVQGAVLSSLVGAGPVSRRYGARHAGLADERWFTLCNLAVRRSAMSPFSSELVCAEENALLAELSLRGELMRYDPELRVFHDRRSTPRSFMAQMFKYGRGRGQLTRRQPRTTRLAYLAPAGFLGYLLLLAVAILAGRRIGLLVVPAVVYCLLAISTAIWVGWTLRRVTDVPLAAALIAVLHACYGTGLLRGMLLPGHPRAETSTGPDAALGRGLRTRRAEQATEERG